MKMSFLIQRLNKSRNGKINPFSFGGGLINGGIPKEAMNLLSQIFSFDYMGAAEFEWGAVPKALDNIAKNHKDYKTFSFKIKDKSIFVIAKEEWKDEIIKRIKGFAKNDKDYRTKERVNLDRALSGKYDNGDDVPEYYQGKGWLELDNGYFFFVDETMFKATAKLFGIK